MSNSKTMKPHILNELELGREIEYKFPNGDILAIEKAEGSYYQLGDVSYIRVLYGEMNDSNEEIGYMVTGLQYFPLSKPEEAVDCFVDRYCSENPAKEKGKSYQLAEIAELNKKEQ